jgi:hypothetical protein
MAKLVIVGALVVALVGCGGGGSDAPQAISIVRTPAQLKWADADTYCRTTTFSNKTGWRLPTQPELSAYAQMGTETGGGAVWSSTPAQATFHLYVSLNSTTGTATAASDASFFYVRCAHD